MAYDAYGRPMYGRGEPPSSRRGLAPRSPPRSSRPGGNAARTPLPRLGGSGRSAIGAPYGGMESKRPSAAPSLPQRSRFGSSYTPSRPLSSSRRSEPRRGGGRSPPARQEEPEPPLPEEEQEEPPPEEEFPEDPPLEEAPEEEFAEDAPPPEEDAGFQEGEEPAQEFEEEEEFGFDPEAGEEPPVEEEEPPPEAEDPDVPQREDDLALEEVPEDMRETVEGNLKLKRLLSTESQPAPNGAPKRRKVEDGQAVPTKQTRDPVKESLLDKWRLGRDVASRYVVQAADAEDAASLKKQSWTPVNKSEGKSVCEQIADRFLRIVESRCPPGGTVDAVTAFKHRWKLNSEDDKLMRTLNHKDLRYVMSHYDSTRPVAELMDEAAMMPPEEDEEGAELAPDKPGPFTIARFNRLELIDPVADALVLGDANLTFSLLLAQHREGLGHVGRIVATTFETIEILRERYKEIDETVRSLEEKSSEVLHNVDCTRLAIDPRFQDMAGKFGAVYYNFPHAGVVNGFFDGHPFVRWRHENLMQLFFRALRSFVKPGGVVKVSSNSNATGVRYTDIMMGAKQSEFVHVETVPFLEWQLRGYRRSYGDRRDAKRRPEDGEIYKSQRAHADMVYSFRYTPSGEAPPTLKIRYPPTKSDLLDSNEGRFRGQSEQAKKRQVEEIYQLFLSYVQGIHVG